MGPAMIFVPLAAAAVAGLVPSNRFRPLLLPLVAAVHLGLTLSVLAGAGAAYGGPWLALDPPGKIILLVVSTLFFFCAIYAVGYLKYRPELSNRIFVSCLLAFLGVISLVAWSQHLGLMWVAIESTTLVTAPLIYYNHTERSIEATWKYLLVGSVGIAMALLGTFFLAYSLLVEGLEPTFMLETFRRYAPLVSRPWLRAAFILLLVGYGTKMGLAPMHTWKPDAYGEAPGVIGAILAGGVTSAAFLALLRVYHICNAAGDGAYTSRLLVFMGLFSMAVAALFMMGQRDFKRMLAYSSVEHMGILVLGLGIGAPALFGTLLHVLTNGLTKGVLFLSAGNIHRAYASKNTGQVSGALRRMPLSAGLFFAGFLAITGSPPFAPFISEFAVLNGIFASGRYAVAGLFLFFLLIVFIGMGKTVLKVTLGDAPADLKVNSFHEGSFMVVPAVVLLALVAGLGLYIPDSLDALLRDAVRFLER